MNSKRSIYLLLPLVLLVWGLIGWRIWTAAGDATPKAERLPAMALQLKTVAAQHRPVLLLTYSDPFKPGPSHSMPPLARGVPIASTSLSGPVLKRATTMNFSARPITAAAAVASVTWPQIKYLGVISHSGNNAQVALLTIDNQELVVKAGKSERGVQVLKLFRDSVQLSFSGQKKSFARNMAN